jgi:23S rRNA (cytosine1962-C5)-methyltransferase
MPNFLTSRQPPTAETTAYRLIHQQPDLAVDRFGDVAVIHTPSRETLATWLPRVRADLEPLCATAYAKVHPHTAREYSRTAEEPVWGPPREEVTVAECGVRYQVRPSVGITVGLFLDMREVRQWLRTVSNGRSVLNLFAYTCSFGVCAALGGARRIVNLDLSKSYLEWGKTNYSLNGLEPDPRDFIYGDAFDWLHRFAKRSQEFELVIVDPPSFSSTPFSVTRDYQRLAASAARVVAPGGVLLAATNNAQTSERRFERWLQDGLAVAGRRGRTFARWHEPAEDFPVRPGNRPYLKVRALKLS